MATKPTAFTKNEVTEKFLTHLWDLINYWDSLPDQTPREKLEGVVFSTLSSIDGCSMDLPGFILAPLPHPEDKEYCIEQGERYYEQNHDLDVKCDISGSLHELFNHYKR